MAEVSKVGIIACSGEEIPAGTVSRLAAQARAGTIASAIHGNAVPAAVPRRGGARAPLCGEHQTITVDGCEKLCAKRGTEQYSGQVAASLVVSEILGDRTATCHRSASDFAKADEEAVWLVAERIAAEVDRFAAMRPQNSPADAPQEASCGCSCGSPPTGGNLEINGKTVAVNGLPLIFEHLHNGGLAPGDTSAVGLLETVRIYHLIEAEAEGFYRDALVAAYGEFCRRRNRVNKA